MKWEWIVMLSLMAIAIVAAVIVIRVLFFCKDVCDWFRGDKSC